MIIDNEEFKLHKAIKDELKKSDEIIISSPFISANDLIYKLMEKQIKLTMIIRLSPPATPSFLEKLLSWMNQNKNIYYYESRSFHSKIYLFRKNNKEVSAIIGSSNFTNGGLRDNYEYNILIKDHLSKTKNYLDSIIQTSDGILSNDVISYYKTWYKPIKDHKRYKRTEITSNKDSISYQEIIEKWDFIRGVLEQFNDTRLPFTYAFDAFCHYFKVSMVKGYNIEKYNSFKKQDLIRYFKIFGENDFPNKDYRRREERFKECVWLRKNIETASAGDLRKFFTSIHSVSSGSGSGNRIAYFKKIATKNEMKKLLRFIIREKLPMPEKFALGLKDKAKEGKKIKYVGPSVLGEIPGWLFPEEYPIVNGKFKYVLNFFKI